MSKDEGLSGLAKGFAFQLVEGFGLLRREAVAQDVKALDQDMRGLLRKHGVRFGQFTIFMPLLLKPAPTRLRLVLWSLAKGLQEFPESPPPGLVTVPAVDRSPDGYDTMSGYRVAGARMIRVDMLERLADQIRSEDTRAGFEAKADMLSITGMTLDQFADLMTGLGYKAERGEREKPKREVVQMEAEGETPSEEAAAETGEAAESATEEDAGPEMEVFYTFTWAPPRRQNDNRRPKQDGRGGPKGKKRPQKGGPRQQKSREFSAQPAKKKDAIDPDNPFAAALMGLRDKS